MKAAKFPVTPAVRELREYKIEFTQHLYKYEGKGGTAVSSRELGVPEHQVIKTLVMETDSQTPFIMLMHGDRQVSLKEMARVLKVKTVAPCTPESAQRYSGYLVGVTSPFGTKRSLPIYAEETVFYLDRIYINGGARGFLVGLNPNEIRKIFSPARLSLVQAAT